MTLQIALNHAFPGFALTVDVTVPNGLTALFGPSGAGKTTVLRAVAGLLTPQSGRITLGDRVLFDGRVNLPPHRRGIGVVFQEARLFPHLNVRQNLTYGGTQDFDSIVDMLGIRPLLTRRPAHLSGGEAQRVALGRALLSGPDLLLMDEPLAALDHARKAEILPYLETLRDQVKIPILYVSHAIDEVARLADAIVVLEGGQVIRAGKAAAVLSGLDAGKIFGAAAGALVTARLAAQGDDGLSRLDTAAGPLFVPKIMGELGDHVVLRIHAQDVMIALTRPQDISALNILPLRVAALAPDAAHSVMVQLHLGEQTLLARITQKSCTALGLRPGLDCFAILKSVARMGR